MKPVIPWLPELIPGTDPVHKVSIIPRGRALGVTMQLPIEDKHSYSRESLLARIAVLMGGRAAEDLIFNTFTTGAGNDIEQATEMARKMVCEWGMSDKMGPLSFGKKDEQIFLGARWPCTRTTAKRPPRRSMTEIKRIVDESYDRAIGLLRENIQNLHNLSECLIEKENLTGAEVDEIIAAGTLSSPELPAAQPVEPADAHTDIQRRHGPLCPATAGSADSRSCRA